jgi:hypothetical protein
MTRFHSRNKKKSLAAENLWSPYNRDEAIAGHSSSKQLICTAVYMVFA